MEVSKLVFISFIPPTYNIQKVALIKTAYQKLNHEELCLFLKVRSLPTSGTDIDLASRLANYDARIYHFPNTQSEASGIETPRKTVPDLPLEIISIILEFLEIPTFLQTPVDWSSASPTDLAMITGNLALIRATDIEANPPSRIGADIAIRFGYVHVLEFFCWHHRDLFMSVYNDDLIPIRASQYGRTSVLSWWKRGFEQHPNVIPKPKAGSIADAVDAASRSGQIASLDWWMTCGHPFEFTEAALEYASIKNQIAVLDWWKQQHKLNRVSLKIGRVMESATRHNRADVLDWWNNSGLPCQYRMCDIEEALEDAIGGGDNTRRWWQLKGVDFNANDKEWMKLQNLN
ncbi:hypothetical protein BDP27DRAFT_1420739 [Rhodocollybia butyracea]|uniref:SAP domain-containing protein n=1 Tax=Rhodocollybia butyracea TaxID=206335 RepID=A0A9P5U832_9AGAR|nr:hypothetical protein BDP27DRAFT_1420739 [Rhodocollybia butyracea]